MAVTHRSLVGDKIAALQAGADDYLVKPVSPDQFDTHVQLISRFRRVIRG
jgi:DNA-binding response OmpR family regulator